MTVAEFLAARLDEAAAGAWAIHDVTKCDALLYEEDMAEAARRDPDCDCGYPARVLREIEAKRQLLSAYLACEQALQDGDDTRWRAGEVFGLLAAVRGAAAVYADHADYPKD